MAGRTLGRLHLPSRTYSPCRQLSVELRKVGGSAGEPSLRWSLKWYIRSSFRDRTATRIYTPAADLPSRGRVVGSVLGFLYGANEASVGARVFRLLEEPHA